MSVARTRIVALALGLCACASDPLTVGPGDAVALSGDAVATDATLDSDAVAADAPTLDAGIDANADDAAATLDALATPDAAPASDGGDADGGVITSSVARFPLVLVHGWAASDTVLGLLTVGEALRREGHQVLVATVPPFDTPAVRATFLAAQVDGLLRDTGAAKINIIAHSMGGLDARHLVSVLGYADRVASVSTIGTPHRGTAVADVVLGLQSGASTVAVDALAAIFGGRISDVDSDPQLRASLRALSEEDAPAFNAAHPDDARVFYQSWAGLSNVRAIPSRNDLSACEVLLFDPNVRDTMDRLLVPLAAMAAHGLRVWPNDGMVPVVSAKWGLYRGCVPADHADEVGAFDDVPPDLVTGFDYLEFYRQLARELAQRGF